MKTALAALVAVAALAAGCGDTTGESTGDTSPTTADGATTTEPTADRPERIVSLSPAATEILFAIGAGDQVVAVDSFSNYPPEAPITDLSAYEPNVEAIGGYEPDLVITDGTNADLVTGLETIQIEVHESPAPADLDGLYAEIEALGEVTGHADEAATVVADMKADIEALLASVPERDEPLTYYHELDDLLYTITSDTFLGQLYSLVGLENIADPADPDGASGGYPQLSPEFLIDADPDLVFLADTKCCAQDLETFGARPGFATLTAVQTGQVVELDDDIASRWGPRVVDLLEVIVDAVVAYDAELDAAA